MQFKFSKLCFVSVLTQQFFSLQIIKTRTHLRFQFEILCIYISPRCKIDLEDTHLCYRMRLSFRNSFNMLIETEPESRFSLI